MFQRKEIEIGGKPLIIETGKMAKQADGAVIVRYGDTVVLVTAVAAKTPREGVDFLPLTVDYRENTYAAGKIPGGFFRREGRPNEKEVLTSRMIDRPLRPLFPEGWSFETQIIGMLLSSDQSNDSDVLAITGASFALGLSDIPFPISDRRGPRRADENGEYLINPTFQQLESCRLNLVVAGSDEAVVMVEAGATRSPRPRFSRRSSWPTTRSRRSSPCRTRWFANWAVPSGPPPFPSSRKGSASS